MSRYSRWIIGACVVFLALRTAHTLEDESAPGNDWTPLVEGKTLEGWTQYNGTATYVVDQGVIVGKTSEGSPNSFLCTRKSYGDFELRFEVKVDDALNSGVQIRSRTRGGKPEGRVHGPQVEIATNGTAGFVYGEALGTGWLSQNRKDPARRAAFKKGEWNLYRIHAAGNRIRTWVNGVAIADLTDEKSGMKSGFIGLQVHGIRRGSGPYEVRWRNIHIRELPVPGFERHHLTGKFYSEGADFGDINGDGKGDIASGPYWYAGPEFKDRYEYYEPKEFNPKGYSNNFFTFTDDVNRDGRLDILVIGFPGAESFWYENSGKHTVKAGKEAHWKRHLVYDVVENESPGFGDIDGDGHRELVFHARKLFGYAQVDPANPAAKWTFHPISGEIAGGRFEHGFGFGDVDGDGRTDVLCKKGWLQQPESLKGDPEWAFHPVVFTPQRDESVEGGYRLDRIGQGGSQMHVYDFDGDGDNDVLTCIEAHGWGLAWHEHIPENGEVRFRMHLIQGWKPEQSAHGLVYTQMHAIDLRDMDGDGVLDVITGKRFWAHNGHDPGGNDPAVLYWYRTVRKGPGDVDFVPHRIDEDSGVGTQVVAGDVNGDGRPDVVVGNKKGTFVFLRKAAASLD